MKTMKTIKFFLTLLISLLGVVMLISGIFSGASHILFLAVVCFILAYAVNIEPLKQN